MRRPAWIGPTGGGRWRGPALIAASLAVHALVLGLLGLRAIELDAPATPGERIILAEIEPRPRARAPSPPAAGAQPPARTASGPAAPAGDRDGPAPPSPRPAVPVAGAPPPPGDPGGGAWRAPADEARPPMLRTVPRIPCPPAPGDDLGRRLCRVGHGIGDEPEMESYPEIAASRQARSDRAREEGFDRQAQANRAWRDYTRGEGPYPGLRSLFSER